VIAALRAAGQQEQPREPLDTPTTPLDPNRYDKIKPVIDRMFAKTATIADHLAYLRFELTEAMNVLPPDAKVYGKVEDGWHASACALRAYASLFQLERLLAPAEAAPVRVGLRENEIRAQECDSLRAYIHGTDRHIGDPNRCNFSVCCDLQVRAQSLRALAGTETDSSRKPEGGQHDS
jgi:hypothetical protein